MNTLCTCNIGVIYNPTSNFGSYCPCQERLLTNNYNPSFSSSSNVIGNINNIHLPSRYDC